jgi:hypothetical protein
LLEAQKKKGGGGGAGAGGAGALMGRRRLAWYEKFHWFITTENYLVLAGKVRALPLGHIFPTASAYSHTHIFILLHFLNVFVRMPIKMNYW